jgi:hypothetical protein
MQSACLWAWLHIEPLHNHHLAGAQEKLGVDFHIIARFPGSALEGATYRHPLFDRWGEGMGVSKGCKAQSGPHCNLNTADIRLSFPSSDVKNTWGSLACRCAGCHLL